MTPLNFICSNNNNSTYLIPTKYDQISIGFFDGMYRKNQKKLIHISLVIRKIREKKNVITNLRIDLEKSLKPKNHLIYID